VNDIESLYRLILKSWNDRDAAAYAACFAEDAAVIGFDGSQMNGRSEIERSLVQIFDHHQTASYVSKIREVRRLADDVALLRAVVGMVPPGGDDINAAVNAVQSLVAAKRNDRWQGVLFQNTPAAFHGRPEAAEELTQELREVLHSSR
jgi:uncharacterized protein (TIGR02246 family)